MNFDWAASLFVVTLIVFGLIVVEEAEIASFERSYASQTVTGSVAQLVADKVDRVEGIAANTTELFDYNNSQVGAVQLPGDLNGKPFTVDFTHDYVIVLTATGTPVGTAVDFWEPVYLFNLSAAHALANSPQNGTDLAYNASTAAGTCESFAAGYDFWVIHESALVDGHPEYLTVISSANGVDHPC